MFKFTKLIILLLSCLILVYCNQKSIDSSDFQDRFALTEEDGLVIPLDSVSPPKAPFIQLLEEDNILTFFNAYNASIYWYDLSQNEYLERTVLTSEGENQVLRPVGYHILNRDSIFVFDMLKNDLVLLNDKGKKLSVTSLINNAPMNDNNWILSYPQFFPKTVTPFIKVDNKLVFSGSFMWAIPDNILNSFKFTASLSLDNNEIVYNHSYPKTIYGSKFNWDDPYYTTVHYDWNPIEKLMVYSFPISNSLFTASLESEDLNEIKALESGSKTVKPISNKRPTREMMLNHLIESDIYAGIKFDKYKNVYYRVLMNGLSDTGGFKDLSGKSISIIIYDHKFNLLGKTNIGTLKNWNVDNMMVSQDGLLIEYIDFQSSNEDYMIFKLFKLIENEN
ncbi:DUF4221 family protein [Belliella pelovolcani]|uniref:DUF4221 domain-containing protein n=1 Tax=Belliella pelovolcani TaxID=529505 RepID=A0A1N7JI07_9BACT|nr:DUF4221 family protein [Belliella pelovolcani]SIS49002.1 protein of unknown function [Belliella pelovolcani]